MSGVDWNNYLRKMINLLFPWCIWPVEVNLFGTLSNPESLNTFMEEERGFAPDMERAQWREVDVWRTNILAWECKRCLYRRLQIHNHWTVPGLERETNSYSAAQFSREQNTQRPLSSCREDPQLCRTPVNHRELQTCPVSGPDTDQSPSTPCPA